MKKKAQSMLEYALVIGIIAAALAAMQLYFKRTIQATVKVAADEIGGQKQGAADYDYKYDWKIKRASDTTTTSSGSATTEQLGGNAVNYGKDDTTTQTGISSWSVGQQKD